MNIKEAWAYGRSTLAQASPTPELDARLLLQYALGVNHSYLVAHAEDGLTDHQTELYRQLVRRALSREPIPYLTNSAGFFGLSFHVGPGVLIPRPETELLVERVLAWAEAKDDLRIADVGTGSGCIAVVLAIHLPRAEVAAVDISEDALVIARKNAKRHAPDRIQFLQGNLLEPLPQMVDLIVANLPYVAAHEWTMVDDGVKWYEPTIALQGGRDGLDLIREMLRQSTSRLRPHGALFLEIGWQQGEAVEQLARRFYPDADVALIADYAGHDRIVSICTQ